MRLHADAYKKDAPVMHDAYRRIPFACQCDTSRIALTLDCTDIPLAQQPIIDTFAMCNTYYLFFYSKLSIGIMLKP